MRYILIFVLIIIFIVFLVSIGIFKNIKSLKPLKDLFFGGFPTSSFSYLPTQSSLNTSFNHLNSNLPEGFKQNEISPYFGKIKIESIKNFGNQFPRYEEIVLSANGLSNNEKINISGWSLFSNKSNFIITFGLKSLDFSRVFKEASIILEPQDKVKIYSSYSPINVNFKLNKCTGYLNDFYNFIPELPNDCQKPSKKEIATLSGLCQEYILKLKTCEVPKNIGEADPSDPKCLNYLKDINYQGCFNKYKNDLDFYQKEWRIFMNKEILDDLHDRVLLYDNKGLVVDEYIY
jgi:hypothetical protein